jgi:hypothetical protein
VTVTFQPPAPATSPLPAALTAAPSSAVPVTPGEAYAVVQAVWPVRNAAIKKGDGHLFAEIESGVALEGDVGDCCSPGNPYGPIYDLQVYVPQAQTSWPAGFAAEVGTTASDGSAWVVYLGFERTSAATPWSIVLATAGEPAGRAVIDEPMPAVGGFDGPRPGTTLTASTLVSELAANWTAAKDHQPATASPDLGPGAWTTQWDQVLSRYRQGWVNINGMVGHYAYRADPTISFSFDLSCGTVVCGALRVEKFWRPPAGWAGAHQDAHRRNWGPGVPPGTCRAIITSQLVEPCFYLTPVESAYVVGAAEGATITLPIR